MSLGGERNKPPVLKTRTGQTAQGRGCLTLIDLSLGLTVSCPQPWATDLSPLDGIGHPLFYYPGLKLGFRHGVEAKNSCTAPRPPTNAQDKALHHSMSAQTNPREIQCMLLSGKGSRVGGSLTISLLPAVRRTIFRAIWQLLLVTHSTPLK